jgi:hypothetical protein
MDQEVIYSAPVLWKGKRAPKPFLNRLISMQTKKRASEKYSLVRFLGLRISEESG